MQNDVTCIRNMIRAADPFMAKNANADYELAGQLIVVTSLFAVVTVFLFIYVFRILGFLS